MDLPALPFVGKRSSRSPDFDSPEPPQKLRRISSEIDSDGEDSIDSLHDSFSTQEPSSKVGLPALGIAIPPFIHAPSCFLDFEKNKNSVSRNERSERAALGRLLPNFKATPKQSDGDGVDDYTEVLLSDFDIYQSPTGKRRGTLAMLNDLGSIQGSPQYCFDGTLRKDGVEVRVQGVTFNTLSIEGYGRNGMDEPATIFIQSLRNARNAIWYRLQEPSSSYHPYHEPFLWIAELGIFFVGFLEYKLAKCENVYLHDFRAEFHEWMVNQPADLALFNKWRSSYGKTDFRQHVIAQADYLWKEATNVVPQARNLSLWREFDGVSLRAIPARPVRELMTTVTPFVLKCFENSYFRDFLKQVSMPEAVKQAWIQKARRLGLSCLSREDLDAATQHPRRDIALDGGKTREGDVVVLEADSNTRWNSDDNGWLAYVQAIKEDRHGPYLSLIWLYKPEDTICAPGYYPFSWEIFMSDHCNCGDRKVRPSEVTKKTNLKFFAKDIEQLNNPFVRQTYVTPDEEGGKDASFVSLEKSHFRCWHLGDGKREALRKISKEHPPRSTVLIQWHEHIHLEPAIIEEYLDNNRVRVRHLSRRADYDADAADNELLETSQRLVIHRKSIERGCIVRRFNADAVRQHQIPAPYSYGGTGDAWCLTGVSHDAGETHVILPLDPSMPLGFDEGFDPEAEGPCEKLKCLSLFSGGGSFDRGLEEGRAMETKWVVEMAKAPIHTYRANLRDPGDAKLYFGSVNDYMQDAIRETPSEVVAKLDEVSVVSAGSPCTGYSMATQDKQSNKSKRDASLVASVMSYINLYCPAYAILENVTAMSHNVKGEKVENVFSQVVSVLVAMGYQVTIVNCDAWSMGSAQSRSRLFLLASAPGLQPMGVPPQTHTHPPRTSTRGLGKTQCDIRFGLRTPVDSVCPFPFVSAKRASKDLPPIGDGRMRTCVRFPDHRFTVSSATHYTSTIRAVPRFPFSQSLASARSQGLLGKALLDMYEGRAAEWHSEGSKAFKRIHPDHLFPTIKTSYRPDCARMGACIHWDDSRAISLLEARRAQSIPDHEVLVGSSMDQIHVVGNGVDRKVSVSLGMSLRRAWLARRTQARLDDAAARAMRDDATEAIGVENRGSPLHHHDGGDDDGLSNRVASQVSFADTVNDYIGTADGFSVEGRDISSTTDSQDDLLSGFESFFNPSTKAWASAKPPVESRVEAEGDSDDTKSVASYGTAVQSQGIGDEEENDNAHHLSAA